MAKQGAAAFPQLGQYLKNQDADVRAEAVKSIVEIGGPRSLDLLVEATRDNDETVQIRATDGLVNFYLPGYVATGVTGALKRASTTIKARFSDRNDQVIDPYILVRPDVIQALGVLVRGGISMDSRANAARAVGILRGKAALPDLYQALQSKNSEVLYESIIAIQKINDRTAAPRIQYLLRDLDEKVQLAAIETTGLLGNQSALPDLRGVLDNTKKTKVRRTALSAIAMLPDPGSRSLYTQYLTDKDENLRAAAAEGFARLRNPEDVPMLQKAYDEETKRIPQLSFAFALVMDGKTELGELTPLRFLINNLNSNAYKGVAQPFLEEASKDPALRNTLYTPMEQGTKDEKINLAQILARTGDKAAEPHLEVISRDKDSQVAEEGLRALRNLRTRL